MRQLPTHLSIKYNIVLKQALESRDHLRVHQEIIIRWALCIAAKVEPDVVITPPCKGNIGFPGPYCVDLVAVLRSRGPVCTLL